MFVALTSVVVSVAGIKPLGSSSSLVPSPGPEAFMVVMFTVAVLLLLFAVSVVELLLSLSTPSPVATAPLEFILPKVAPFSRAMSCSAVSKTSLI